MNKLNSDLPLTDFRIAGQGAIKKSVQHILVTTPTKDVNRKTFIFVLLFADCLNRSERHNNKHYSRERLNITLKQIF